MYAWALGEEPDDVLPISYEQLIKFLESLIRTMKILDDSEGASEHRTHRWKTNIVIHDG